MPPATIQPSLSDVIALPASTPVPLALRVQAYHAEFGEQFPDSVPAVSASGRWLTGVWLLGNAYQGSGYYGAYPPSYLRRVTALFPEVPRAQWLHLFSGSLEPSVPGIRLDIRPPGDGVVAPTVRAQSTALPFLDASIRLTAADPPYTPEDAKKYKTAPVNKNRTLHELARVTRPNGHLIWLDTMLPMYRKDQWHHWGMICVQRSTNHRTRLCSLFTRV